MAGNQKVSRPNVLMEFRDISTAVMPPEHSYTTPCRDGILYACASAKWSDEKIMEMIREADTVATAVLNDVKARVPHFTLDGAYAFFFYGTAELSIDLTTHLRNQNVAALAPYAVILHHLDVALRSVEGISDHHAYCCVNCQSNELPALYGSADPVCWNGTPLDLTTKKLDFVNPATSVLCVEDVFVAPFGGPTGTVLLPPCAYVKVSTSDRSDPLVASDHITVKRAGPEKSAALQVVTTGVFNLLNSSLPTGNGDGTAWRDLSQLLEGRGTRVFIGGKSWTAMEAETQAQAQQLSHHVQQQAWLLQQEVLREEQVRAALQTEHEGFLNEQIEQENQARLRATETCAIRILTAKMDSYPAAVQVLINDQVLSLDGTKLVVPKGYPKAKLTNKILADVAEHCPQLKHLDISNRRNITDVAMEAVAKHCKALEYLDVSNTNGNISTKGIKAIAFASSVNLKHVDVSYTRGYVTDGAIDAVAQLCPQLEFLSVRKTRGWISDAAMKTVAKTCTNLQHLDVSETAGSITDAGMTVLAAGCTQLRHLKIGGIWGGITDNTIEALGEHCPELRSLDLSNTKRRRFLTAGCITDVNLVLAASKWAHLEHLDVRNADIMEAAIDNIVRKCKALEKDKVFADEPGLLAEITRFVNEDLPELCAGLRHATLPQALKPQWLIQFGVFSIAFPAIIQRIARSSQAGRALNALGNVVTRYTSFR